MSGGGGGGGRLWKYLEAQFGGTSSPERIQSTLTPTRARICKSFMEPRNRFLAGGPVRQPYLTYRPAMLHKLAESIPLQIQAQIID
jgi:hypothetical protein